MTTRRDFLKTACGFCAALGSVGLVSTLLEGCKSIPVIKASPQNNRVAVPVSSFAEGNYVFVRASGQESDILLIKRTDGTYNALLMLCTHESQPLTLSGSSIYCASHGSSFDLEGKVTKAPATRPLQRFPATVEGDSVIIQLNR